MSHFEYLSVLMSIVIAFAMSETLSGWGRLIRQRERVRVDLLSLGWSVFAVLLMIQWWWGFWEYRTREAIGFFGFLALLSQPITLVLLTFVLLPSTDEAGAGDLRGAYLANRRWIFGLAALLLIEISVVDALVGRQPFWHPENLVRGLGLALTGTLAWSPSVRLHGALLIAAYALLFAFLLVTFHAG